MHCEGLRVVPIIAAAVIMITIIFIISIVKAAQRSRRVGRHLCRASDCLCNVGQIAFLTLPWDSDSVCEMNSLDEFVLFTRRKHQNCLQGFCKHRLPCSVSRNSGSLGLELAQGSALKIASPLMVLMHNPGWEPQLTRLGS